MDRWRLHVARGRPATRRVSTVSREVRRGMSLIEIVAVMAANFAFVAAAVSLLLAHIRADRELTERLNRRLELAPIIASLRDDLRAANRATFDDQTLALEISEGETIR